MIDRTWVDRLPCPIRSRLRWDGDCLLWTGGSSSGGYGQLSYGYHEERRTWMAHRLVYTLIVGPIPEGLHLDHVRARGCGSRLCCNVEHLEPVTQAENNRRSDAGKVNNAQARKTHCPRGHRYDGRRGKGRYCRTCHRESQARYLTGRRAERS